MTKIFPSHADYDRSIGSIAKLVKVPQLIGGYPIKNNDGRYYAYSGGFAKVYRIKVGQKEYALRCWLAEQTEIEERYKIIGSYISSTTLPYFINFNYYEKGIISLTNGKSEPFPVICMEWIPQPTLGKFIKNNVTNRSLLESVANAFKSMVSELHKNKIAHGDLQVGNIIVMESAGNISLKLIDYDSLYFPSLTKFSNLVGGVAGFQSPNRPIGYFNERMDYFSELVIYLSLMAFAQKPELCKFPEELMLFQEDDLKYPEKSNVFQQLENECISIKQLTKAMKDYCYVKDINHLIPLEQVIYLVSNGSYKLLGTYAVPQRRVIPTQPRIVHPQKPPLHQKPVIIRPDHGGVVSKNLLQCSSCGENIHDPSQVYCSKGHSINGHKNTCPRNVEHLVPYNAKYCPKCGQKI